MPVAVPALITGFDITNTPVIPKRIAASKCRENPAQFPTRNASANSMRLENTSVQPKNTIGAAITRVGDSRAIRG